MPYCSPSPPFLIPPPTQREIQFAHNPTILRMLYWGGGVCAEKGEPIKPRFAFRLGIGEEGKKTGGKMEWRVTLGAAGPPPPPNCGYPVVANEDGRARMGFSREGRPNGCSSSPPLRRPILHDEMLQNRKYDPRGHPPASRCAGEGRKRPAARAEGAAGWRVYLLSNGIFKPAAHAATTTPAVPRAAPRTLSLPASPPGRCWESESVASAAPSSPPPCPSQSSGWAYERRADQSGQDEAATRRLSPRSPPETGWARRAAATPPLTCEAGKSRGASPSARPPPSALARGSGRS